MEQAQGDPGRQEQASRVLTQAADGGIAGPDTGLGLDAFVNASHLNLGQATAAASAGIDWEHIDRSPTGSTITDGGAVIDESGRTFHGYKEGKYFLPNDAAEQDRLDLQHAGFQHLFEGKLYRAPLQNPRNVLDIATGTGIWAMDFAEQHPEAQVIGTDLSDIQPKWKLPNCSFIQDDAEDEWLFGSTQIPIQFDYVHLRMVLTCFDNPRGVMRNAFRNMRPGGWIEYQDLSSNFQSIGDTIEGTALKRSFTLLIEGLAKKGRDLDVPRHYAQFLREEGFVDVVEERFLCPINPWPEDPRLRTVGQFMMTNCYEGLRGVCWKAHRAAGLAPDEIEALVDQSRNDLTNGKHRVYSTCYVVYGRKPLASEISL